MSLIKYKLTDLYTMGSGLSSKPEQAGHGSPFISFSTIFNNPILPSNITDKMDTTIEEQIKHSVKKGDVLITRTSETLDELAMTSVALKDYPTVTFSGFAKRLRPTEMNTKMKITYDKYMSFFFRSDYFRKIINNMSIMTLRASFNEQILSYISIDLPDYTYQVKIGDMLYSIYAQIERNNAMVKRLQVLAQAIFNKLFSQDSTIVSLVDFPYIEILKPGIDKFDGKKHYIATAEVEGEKFNYDAPLIEYATRENRANMQPVKNSVWFAKLKKSIKHIYVSNEDDLLISDYVFSTGFCGIKCDDIAFEYLINYLNLSYFEKEKDILSHGATMEGVNNEDLKSFKIHLPSKEKLLYFHDKTKNIHCQISKINQMTYQLVCLKEKLLPLLINGQLQ